MLDSDIKGEGALDEVKKRSESKAILLFFKSFFPKNYTWKNVVNFIKTTKDPIKEVLELKSRFTI